MGLFVRHLRCSNSYVACNAPVTTPPYQVQALNTNKNPAQYGTIIYFQLPKVH